MQWLNPKIDEPVRVPKTAEERANKQIIQQLYMSAEGASKDTPKFVSLFAQNGYFYDVSGGKKYYGEDLGFVVDVYAAAFPDMHRELHQMYFMDDVVVVELTLNGTNNGDLVTPDGTVPATRKEMHTPCCDVFHLKGGKVTSFHCYVAVPIMWDQLGVFNISSAVKA
jgi:ketosteroid isomerase-like protein